MTARTPDILAQGALVVPNFVTPAEERRILERIASAAWLRDLNRRVQHYGFKYDYRSPSARDRAVPFPPWTEHMARRLLQYFDGVLPSQCIVNEYLPGQGIGMHADHRDFGAVVASLSLADDWPMRFRPRNARPYVRQGAPGDRVLTLPRRSSVLVLRRQARHAWMHGIDPSDTANRRATRVSARSRLTAASAMRWVNRSASAQSPGNSMSSLAASSTARLTAAFSDRRACAAALPDACAPGSSRTHARQAPRAPQRAARP